MVDVAELVVWAAWTQAPTLGATRLVCVDGAAGSGKSTLAGAVHDAGTGLGSVALVHTDDLLDGWGGLEEAGDTVHDCVLAPVSAGRPGRYRRYDWLAGRFAEEVTVGPVDLLVLEGVGCWRASYASWVTTLVWVDAPPELRLARGLARDGERLRAEWERWLSAEEALFRRERTSEHAAIVVDGTGEADHDVILR